MSAPSFTPAPWSVAPFLTVAVTTSPDEDGNVRSIALSHFYDRSVAGSKEEAEANARLIAAAPDHADICWAMCMAAGRWEPWGDGRGEFCINGMRYTTELDEFSAPIVTPALRAQIAKARGDTSLPSPSSHSQRCGGATAGGTQSAAGGASFEEARALVGEAGRAKGPSR
jgi:hypothetical protein